LPAAEQPEEHGEHTPPPGDDSLAQRLRAALRQPLARSSFAFFRPGERERPRPAPGLAAGKIVGDFRLVSLIGQGGMGQV
jgi:hypothetical protein